MLVSHSRTSNRELLAASARTLAEDIGPKLEQASGCRWRFRFDEPIPLGSGERRHAGDFVAEASLRLVESSFDLVVILTDVPLTSRRERLVFGLASPLTRTIVLSTHRLRDADRGRVAADAPEVRWNAAALLLHLIGQVLGVKARPSSSGAMAPFAYRPDRRTTNGYRNEEEFRRRALAFSTRRHFVTGPVKELRVHLGAAARNLGQIGNALVRNRAPLLPLRMPGLATAAVAPVFLLVFNAEFWDAGLGMSHTTAWAYAAISVLAATLYLCFVQNLFLPRAENRCLPEHLAVANVVIFSSMLLAVIGLFLMVALLALAITLGVFPPGLISTWPTLNDEQADLPDILRVTIFISTVGVTTGALAGGMQRRRVMRHMALFQKEI